MPRPIEYNRTDVLDHALGVFWRLGHAACSMQILADATGLSRQSIYNVFGDKDGLFRAVLAHYRAKIEDQCHALESANAGLSSLRGFILEGLAAQRALGPGACFIVVTAFSPQAHDTLIKPALDEGAQRVRNAFATVLIRAQVLDEIRAELSPDTASAHIYTIMNGLSALEQTGGTKEQIEITLDLTFRALMKDRDEP